MRIMMLILALALAAQIKATVLSDAVATMQPGTFKPISTNLTYGLIHGGPVADIIWAFGSECNWEPGTQQLMFIGSPHGAESKFIIYDAAANSWREELTCREPQTSATRFGHSYDMRTMDTDSGIYWIHTYNAGPAGHALFKYYARRDTTPVLYKYDSILTSGTWDASNTNSIAYFPDKKCIIAYSGGDGAIRRLDPATRTWHSVGSASAAGFEVVLEYNPLYHCMIVGGGSSIQPLRMLDTNYQLTTLTTPSVVIGAMSSELTCDPNTGDLIVFDGTKVRAFSMESRTWRDIALNPSALASFGMTGGNIITGSIPELNCHVILNATSYAMLIYKHSEGVGNEKAKAMPRMEGFSLSANPNPFSSASGVRIGLDVKEAAVLSLFGPAGQMIRSLNFTGTSVVRWDGRDMNGNAMPPGCYYMMAKTKSGKETAGKIIISK